MTNQQNEARAALAPTPTGQQAREAEKRACACVGLGHTRDCPLFDESMMSYEPFGGSPAGTTHRHYLESDPLWQWRCIAKEAEIVVTPKGKFLMLSEEMCVRLGSALEDASPSRECGETKPAGPVDQAIYQAIADNYTRENPELVRPLSDFERVVLEYIAFNDKPKNEFINIQIKAREMLDVVGGERQGAALSDEQISLISEKWSARWSTGSAWNTKRCIDNAIREACTLIAASAPTLGESHSWDDEGDHCTKCGDPAWCADKVCKPKVVAAHNAGAQEPVAWRVSGTYTNGLHFSHLYDDKVTAEKSAASAAMRTLTPLYAHPQPITDAARDAKRYQAIRAKVLPFNAYASGNPNWTFPDYGPRGATFDEAIDAEIERLDRAKGE